MFGRERREQAGEAGIAQLRKDLTPQQLATLDTMQQFGWALKFVRRQLFQAPVPVAFDRARKRFAVIEADGSLNENPGFRIRE